DELNEYKNQITLRTTIEPEFAPGLDVGAFYTLDLNNSYHKLFKEPWTLYYPLWETAQRDSEGFITSMELEPRLRGLDSPELTDFYDRNINTMSQFSANYQKGFGDHTFSVFGAFEQFQIKSNGFNAYRKYFISDLVQTLAAGGEKDKDNSGYLNVYARSSWIGRLNYNYKEKYLAEFIFRRELGTIPSRFLVRLNSFRSNRMDSMRTGNTSFRILSRLWLQEARRIRTIVGT